MNVHKLKQEVLSDHQEIFLYYKSDQTLAHVSQGGCGVSLLGDTQNHVDMVLCNWL